MQKIENLDNPSKNCTENNLSDFSSHYVVKVFFYFILANDLSRQT